MFPLGLLAALAASALFNLGVALQALDARAEPADHGLRLSLLGRLLRRPRWVVGFLLGGLGFPLEVAAFAWAPFVVVQPVLAAGLILLLVLGVRMLGESVGRPEVVGVAAIVAGVGLVAWGAPSHTETHRSPGQVAAVVAVLSIAAFVPFALRGRRWDTAGAVIVGSAIAFAAGNVATKLMADDFNNDHWLNASVWLAVTIVTGIAAIVLEMTALQRSKATTVVPASFAIQTFLPIALEPLFLRERLATADLYGAPLVTGIVLLFVGTLAVSRTRAVTEMVASDAAPT